MDLGDDVVDFGRQVLQFDGNPAVFAAIARAPPHEFLKGPVHGDQDVRPVSRKTRRARSFNTVSGVPTRR